MRTQHEKQYEKLIVSMIIHQASSKSKQESCILEFLQNSRKWYEDLCDALYAISVGATDQCLRVDSVGRPRLCSVDGNSDGVILCCPEMLPDFQDDLIEQLDFVFAQMGRFLQKEVTGPKLSL